MNRKRRFLNFWATLATFLVVLAILLGGLTAYARVAPTYHADAAAGAQVVGSLDTGNVRAVLAPTNSQPKRVIYFDGVVRPTGGTTTPVVSRESCGWNEQTAFRMDAYLSGTMTGTNPTAAILWEYSLDEGDTWISVGTWTTINATVTPASQSNIVYDHDTVVVPITTPQVTPATLYGDCWRAVVTFGGTGAVGATLTLVQYGK